MWESLVRSFLRGAVAGARGSGPAQPRRKSNRGRHRWTRDEFLSALKHDPVELGVANELLAWVDDRRLREVGTRAASPGLAWHLDALGWDYTFFIASTLPSRLGLEFGNLSRRPVLDDPARLAALVSAIDKIYASPASAEQVPIRPPGGLGRRRRLPRLQSRLGRRHQRHPPRRDGIATAARRP